MNETQNIKQFKVGDEVRVINDASNHKLNIGSTVTIVTAVPEDGIYKEKSGRYFGAEEAELILKPKFKARSCGLPQIVLIERHLEQGKKITPLKALNLFGCFRISARIFDLKRQGMNIKSEMVKVGKGKFVAEYSLINE